jgi:hypothetical protein
MDWTEIIVACIGACTTILSVILGKMLVSRHIKSKRDPIRDDLETNENILMCLDYILEQTGSDRTYVLQFHNGGYYVSGKSQQKFSCTHESCTPGTSRESVKSQNHLVSNYHNYIHLLINNGEYYYSNTGEIKDETLKNLVLSKGVISIYNIPLKTLDGKIIGILGVDYVKNKADPIFSRCDKLEISSKEQMKDFLKSQARILSAYLI